MRKRVSNNFNDRTSETCGNDISDLPDNYKNFSNCYMPTYCETRRNTTGKNSFSLFGEILTNEHFNKGYYYGLECYKKYKL